MIVYADGACLDNGNRYARAGWGVHFPEEEDLDDYGSLPGHPTNNRAELYAVLKALEISIENDFEWITIRTDSTYCIQIFTKLLRRWKRNGMRRSNGYPPANLDLIEDIDDKLSELEVDFEFVPGHSGDPGNDEADRLARLGCDA